VRLQIKKNITCSRIRPYLQTDEENSRRHRFSNFSNMPSLNKESPPQADGVFMTAFEKSFTKPWPAALKETPQGAGN